VTSDLEAKVPHSKNILLLVISEKNSQRSKNLTKKLNEVNDFKMTRVDAVMTRNSEQLQESEVNYDQDKARYYLGRNMLPSEIGCAASHNIARKLISESPWGGVILEDDARIPDLDLFSSLVTDFLEKNKGGAAILSLAGWKPKSFDYESDYEISREVTQIRLLGHPPLALAYALTPLAAQLLYKSNRTIFQVSDWPKSKCRYFVTSSIVVYHGDQQTQSIIDPEGSDSRKRPDITSRLRVLFLWQMFSKSAGFSAKEYFFAVWLQKVKWYADNFLIVRLKK
jgi:hypothetical protein